MTDFAQLQTQLNNLITAVNALQAQITAEKGAALGTATLNAQQRLQPAQHAPLNSGQVYVGNESNVPTAEGILAAIAARSTNGANQPLVLDGSGKIVEGNLPTSIVTGARFKGGWDASTNTPDLIAAKATAQFGDYYYVNVAGSTDLDGETEWTVGDFAILADSGDWTRLDNNDDVTSVQGDSPSAIPQKGAIVLSLTDFALANDEIAIGNSSGIATFQKFFTLLESILVGESFDFYDALIYLYKQYAKDINTQAIATFGNLAGGSKWHGGVAAPNGNIYGIPFQSTSILEINPVTQVATTFGSLAGTLKWAGGVLARNGKIYFIPFESVTVGELNPTTKATTTFGSLAVGTGKWSGGVLAPNGKIYGIPYQSTTVLEIDPLTNTATTFGSLAGTAKWSGGVLAPNGKIYGIPYDSSTVLEIDPLTNTVTTFGSLAGTAKWSGGVLAPNGKIYGIPRESTSILEIDPVTKTTSTFGSLAGNIKWIGGVLGVNGKIYGIPYNSTSILEVDPLNRTTNTFGNLTGSDKWTGGVLGVDGKIYGIPVSSTTILSIGENLPISAEFTTKPYVNKF